MNNFFSAEEQYQEDVASNTSVAIQHFHDQGLEGVALATAVLASFAKYTYNNAFMDALDVSAVECESIDSALAMW